MTDFFAPVRQNEGQSGGLTQPLVGYQVIFLFIHKTQLLMVFGSYFTRWSSKNTDHKESKKKQLPTELAGKATREAKKLKQSGTCVS